jgi:putative endonuclease
MIRGGSVYILTNYDNDVFYIGVTSNLFSRITEHKEKYYPSSFTAKYNCYKLVYFEHFMNIEEAIAKEKQLKNWKRQWKINLINNFNPTWEDLFYKLDE